MQLKYFFQSISKILTAISKILEAIKIFLKVVKILRKYLWNSLLAMGNLHFFEFLKL